MDTTFKAFSAACGAVVGYLYGEWSAMLGVLLVFVLLDYATGVTAAAVEGSLASSIGYRGIARKVGIFMVVAAAHLVDTTLGNGSLIMDAAVFWYLANELLSLVENMGRIGVPIPPVIARAIDVLKGKGEVEHK